MNIHEPSVWRHYQYKLILLLEFVALVKARNLTYGAYTLGPVCNPSQEIRYPRTNKDVVAIVKEAIREGLTVKAFGSRHSITDIICTEGIPVDLKYLQKKVINSDKSATFGAGVILYDAGLFLTANGRALKTVPSYGNITVAGAVGTAAHGTSIKYPSTLSEQVIGVTIVDGRGQIRKIRCKSTLKAFRVHLGLLGIIVDITFKTVPFYKIMSYNYEMSDEIFTDGRAESFAKETDQLCLFWYPGLKKVILSNWTNVDGSTAGNAYANLISGTTELLYKLDDLSRFPDAESAAKVNETQAENYRGLLENGTKSDFPFYTEDGTTQLNPAVGDWNQMTVSICPDGGPRQCVYLQKNGPDKLEIEFAMPLSALPQIAHRLHDIYTKTPVAFPYGGLILRFSGATDTYMSPSHGRDTVQLGFFIFKRRNTYEDAPAWLAAYQTFEQAMIKEMRGRSHWGKSGFYYHTRDMIQRKLNPAAKAAFVAQMEKYDPNGVFMNHFGRRLRGYGTKQDTDPRTKHCAILDNCVCRINSNCANYQRCGTLRGYNYPVCQNNS